MSRRHTAASRRLAVCGVCGWLATLEHCRCPRCQSPLHLRKPDSLARTWALMLAAYVLYLPANLLPIMETRSPFGTQRDTIMSGVVVLWDTGSWELALVVFCASIVLPMLKLFSLTYLLLSVHHRSHRNTRQRARLYRLLELIGRWSMLDVYVVTLLVALVRVQSLAIISPGPGVVAFGAVVVLSMLATMAFDPRLIWDRAVPPPTPATASAASSEKHHHA